MPSHHLGRLGKVSFRLLKVEEGKGSFRRLLGANSMEVEPSGGGSAGVWPSGYRGQEGAEATQVTIWNAPMHHSSGTVSHASQAAAADSSWQLLKSATAMPMPCRMEDSHGTLFVSIPSLLDPSVARPGHQVVHVFTPDWIDAWKVRVDVGRCMGAGEWD